MKTDIYVLFFLSFLFLAFESKAVTISPPRAHFDEGERVKVIKVNNNSKSEVAIYVDINRDKVDSDIYLTSSADEVLIPPGGSESIKLVLVGDGGKEKEALFYVSIVELIRDVEHEGSSVNLSFENTLKAIYTPKGLGESKLEINGSKFVNTGPRYIQLLSLVCEGKDDVRNITLFEPFSESIINEDCTVVGYKELRYGKTVIVLF